MAAGVLLALAAGSCVSAGNAAPHIVFVLVDDLGFNDFYTSTDIGAAWPNVARLVSEQCLSIDQYYTQPVCTPTRGAFMTGRMPIRLGLQHGVIEMENFGLPLDEVTLATKLKQAGYVTAGVGKWHLGMYNNASLPTRRGFDHWYGFWQGGESHSTHVFPPPVGGLPTPGALDLNDDEVIDRGQSGVYSAELFGGKAAARIRAHKAGGSGRPLFLYLPFQNVHNPLEAPARYTDAAPCASVPDPQRRTFCGMALAVDAAIGNVTAALDAAFAGEDVLVLISGDNGGMPGTRGGGNGCPSGSAASGLCLRGGKGQLFEGGVRNNMLVCSASLLPAQRRGTRYTGGLVHVLDWHTTLAGLGGAAAAGKPLDGVDVWPALLDGSASPRAEFLLNHDPCAMTHGGLMPASGCPGPQAAYRLQGCAGTPPACGDWKLIVGANWNGTWYPVPAAGESWAPYPPPGGIHNATYLFNVSGDPSERSNVAAAYPDVVAALQAKIDAALQDEVPPCNIDGGDCVKEDKKGLAQALLRGAWEPWVPDP